MTKKAQVKCPGCNIKFAYYDSEFRPFCCEKCKMLDLGNWLDESYSIKGRDNTVYIEDSESLQNTLEEEY